MPYVKGGAAWVHSEYSVVAPNAGVNASADEARVGYTVGGGIEVGFAPRWSAFVEYDYIGLGSDTISLIQPGAAATAANFKTNVQMVKAGINYKFWLP